MERVALATGASICSRIEELTKEKLGFAGKVESFSDYFQGYSNFFLRYTKQILGTITLFSLKIV